MVSTSGVLPELVGTAGAVVPEDAVPELTAALQRLLDQPEERRRLGAEGRTRVLAEFTDAALARKTLEFWSFLGLKRASA